MQTILVTGGAGFIGSNFIRTWFNKFPNSRVLNVDKLTYSGNLENLKDIESNKNYLFFNVDIVDSEKLTQIFNEYKPQFIFHFAAESHVDRSILGPEEFVNTNVVGTFRLLEVSRKYYNKLSNSEKEIFRFLHVSTDEVFGTLNFSDKAFSETTAYQPNSPYSASKAASDHFVRAYFHTYNLPVVTTNCSNNYGPYQHTEKLIPHMIKCALEKKPLPIYGNGQNIRDWLYVTDHCEAIIEVIQHGRLGETYNIGGKNELNNLQVVGMICDLLNELYPMNDNQNYHDLKTFVNDRPGHDLRYAIDPTKIENEIIWTPKETFQTGFRKTVTWYIEKFKNNKGVI